MLKAQKEIPPFAKDATNPHANSKYITLDNILEKILLIFNEQDITLFQPAYEHKNVDFYGVGVATMFMHVSGEFIYFPPVYFQFEKGGRMNLTQSTGSLITYARRYMLTTILGLRTGEDTDGVIDQQSTPTNHSEPNRPLQPKKINEIQSKSLKVVLGNIANLTGQDTVQTAKILLEKQGLPKKLNDLTEDQYGLFLRYLNGIQQKYEEIAEREKQEKNQQSNHQQESFEGPQWGVKSKHD